MAVVMVTAVTTTVVIMAMGVVTGLMVVIRAPMEAVLGTVVTGLMEAVPLMAVIRVLTGLHRLHLHPLLNTADIYGHGRPTRIANTDRDVRQPEGSLPVSEKILQEVCSIPWFKHYRPQIIEEHATAFRKVAEHADELLDK